MSNDESRVPCGPYDDGYARCPCFWGREPGSLIRRLEAHIPSFAGLAVLDAGCGEGKNAAYLSDRGAVVHAIDCSALALANAREAWRESRRITWELGDIASSRALTQRFDLVIAYGLLHCLESTDTVARTVGVLQSIVQPGGFHVICSFNSRFQDLSAHPGFSPTLLAHAEYLRLYSGWTVLFESDTDLHEVHPHNAVPHTHSMTRIIARRPKP